MAHLKQSVQMMLSNHLALALALALALWVRQR
jgi:hypothetical protein